MSRSPFPLQWPDGWKRTAWRRSSNFDKSAGFNAARDGVLRQLKMLGTSHVVITSNLPTNSKGQPYNASAGKLADPGIAVWWVKGGKEQVMPCDRWLTCVENMHAIELSIAAIRGIDRWGTAGIVEKAFAGFAALPEAGATSIESPAATAIFVRNWQAVFEVAALIDVLAAKDLLAIVKARHRDLIKKHHPDLGGDLEAATEINAALAEAERALS